MSKNSRAVCPHCSSKASIKTSKKITAITREIYFQCSNFECGHTWAALLSAVRTIVPSRIPNPDVHIPQSSRYEPMTETSPSG